MKFNVATVNNNSSKRLRQQQQQQQTFWKKTRNHEHHLTIIRMDLKHLDFKNSKYSNLTPRATCPFSWQQPTLLASWRPFDNSQGWTTGKATISVGPVDQCSTHTHTHLLSHPLRHILEDLSLCVWVSEFVAHLPLEPICPLFYGMNSPKASTKNLFPSKQWLWGPKVYSSNVGQPLCQFWLAVLEEIHIAYYCITSHDLHRFTEMLYVPLLQHQRASSDITFFATGILCFVWSTWWPSLVNKETGTVEDLGFNMTGWLQNCHMSKPSCWDIVKP